MAFQRWKPDTRRLFRETTIEEFPETWTGMDDATKNFVRGMFDYGFVNQKASSPVRVEARNRYFDEMDIDPDEFDWNAWRRYMGYDEDTD